MKPAPFAYLRPATLEEALAALAGQQGAKVRWVRTEGGGGGEKEGLYEWVCELKAGKKVRLEAEWEAKAPSSMGWEEIRLAIQPGKNKGV